MERDEVKELHFITPIANLDSILHRGILSHDDASKIDHQSVASEDVQDRRRGKWVPNGQRLHSYANLYFHARNPMMYYLVRHGHNDLAVIRVSEAVLELSDTVLTDGNAASAGTRFYSSPDGLAYLNSKLIFARYWTDENYWPDQEKKRSRNAEVLVPGLISSTYIQGCYVDTPAKRSYCEESYNLPAVTVRKGIFFQ
jgi:ssDNA thymidine ADP-ribosyltransferase, DarT